MTVAETAARSEMSRLMALAAEKAAPGQRDVLYQAVSRLYELHARDLATAERELMLDILRRLAREVEMGVRRALAERLAAQDNAPHDLILLLADDRIEVAHPVLAMSTGLSETDLVKIVRQTSDEHREIVAGRPDIRDAVASALCETGGESVLVALVRNPRAAMSPGTLGRIADRSREFERVQEPLLQRKDLPKDLAEKMYVWVSQALRSYIVDNYPVDRAALDAQIADAASQAAASGPSADVPAEQRLVDKLAAAGQLRPGFLVKALNQGQNTLFEHAFARLLGTDVAMIRNAFYERGGEAAAAACRAVGIDRSVFPTIYRNARASHALPWVNDAGETRALEQALALDPAAARTLFDRLTRN